VYFGRNSWAKVVFARAIRSGNDVELHGNFYPSGSLQPRRMFDSGLLTLHLNMLQYSSGRSNVVTDRSASVMIQICSVSVTW